MIVVGRPHVTTMQLESELREPIPPQAVEAFEAALEKTAGVAGLRAVDSGRGALYLALRALGVTAGDEVIIPAFICHVIADAVLAAGARPVLADCQNDSPVVCPEHVASLVGPRTRAVLLANVYGISPPLEDIREIIPDRGVALIEDRAHTLSPRPSGAAADVSIFSFNFDKPVTTGYGGAIAVRDRALLARVDTLLRQEQSDETGEHEHLFGLLTDIAVTRREVFDSYGYGIGRHWLRDRDVREEFDRWRRGNAFDEDQVRTFAVAAARAAKRAQRGLMGRVRRRVRSWRRDAPPSAHRMGEARAAAGLAALRRLPAEQERRNANAAAISAATISPLRAVVAGGQSVDWLRYSVLARDPAMAACLSGAAGAAGIQAGPLNWPVPIQRLSKYRGVVSFDEASLRRADSFAARVINLPIHGELRSADLETIAHLMRSAAKAEG